MTTSSVPLRARRAALLAAVIVLALVGCEPTPTPPAPPSTTVGAPTGAVLGVASTSIVRSATVSVSASACAEDFQYVEVRLVVGTGAQRRAVHVTTTSGGEPAELTVPAWTPDGPAELEGSCLEPNFSHASDGADVLRFDYPTRAVTVAGGPPAVPAPVITAPATVDDATLEVSGTGCTGRVLVSVATGLVPSASRFHHGRTLVTPGPDGSWSASVPLTYRVGEFTDPAAPGPLTAFAVCDGRWYAPAPFEVATTSPMPAVHLVGPSGGLLGLTQCPSYNTLSLLGVVTLASGATTAVGRQVPGPGFGEHLHTVALPSGAVAVQWYASCQGAHPSFVYEPAHWAAP